MSRIAAVFEAIEFAERHLGDAIAVGDMADAACYSLYHFCRTFNQIVHHSPYDYLVRRRLSESARELVETGRRVIDIALDYQFNSPEAYSRAFKRMFGLQPTQWRGQGIVDSRFLMSRLTMEHLEHRNRGDYLRPVLEQRDAIQVAGIATLVRSDGAIISHVWDILAQELARRRRAEESGCFYGLVSYPRRWDRHGYVYMAAVEVDSLDVAASALVLKTLPPSTYARFIHKGPYRDLQLTLDYVYHTWLPRSGQRLAHPLVVESYGPHPWVRGDPESEMEIHVPVE
jgi:AraC family transcriptional regulator